MNPLAFLVTLFGCVSIIAVFVSIAHFDRAELLSETLQEHTSATGALLSHCEALERYCAALESANRYNRAVAAGFMLTAQAVDVAERMTMEEGAP